MADNKKAYTFEDVGSKYKKAYEHWTKEDDRMLQERSKFGDSIQALAGLLQRKPSAIESRLRKLGSAPETIQRTRTGKLRFSFDFQWKPVKRDPETDYFFSESITSHMAKSYNQPAIYRWNVYVDDPTESLSMYIGSTKELCPERLVGYLKPGPSQQTNQRLNRKFREYILAKCKVRLEILDFELIADNFEIDREDLKDEGIRLFVESLLITLSRKANAKMLNLRESRVAYTVQSTDQLANRQSHNRAIALSH